MKLKVVDGNKLILPCKPGDTYYTIERIAKTTLENYVDPYSGEFKVRENTKTIGKRNS